MNIIMELEILNNKLGIEVHEYNHEGRNSKYEKSR